MKLDENVFGSDQLLTMIIPSEDIQPIIYEDVVACITRIKVGYIRGDRTKHISPKFF